MINVYIPRELYRFLSLYSTFNPTKDINSFTVRSETGDVEIHQMPTSFFEELNKSQPLIDALIKESKREQRLRLQQQIANTAEKHKQLLNELKEFEND